MDAISQIKQKLDIVDVVGSYVSIKKAGKNYKGVCPFHSEDTPSFMVAPELQIFKCFGCGAAGDMFNFVEKIEGVDFGAALEILAEKAGVTLEKGDFDAHAQLKKKLHYINELTAKFYNYLLTKHSLGKEGLDYLVKKRQLTPETINEFMLGYAPQYGNVLIDFLSKKGILLADMVEAGVVVKKSEGIGYMDKFRGRVLFPFIGIDGKFVGFTGRTLFDKDPKYLNTSETPVYHKSSFLYGLFNTKLAIKKKGVVLVEGNMDLVSAVQNGFDNVVAASGTAVTDSQLQLLARYTKDIIICLDSDSAGVAAAFRAVDLAEKQDFNIKVAVYPEGAKDIDELVRIDKSKVEDMLSHAIPAYDFFITATIKKHDTHSPDGKKKIMEELAPKFQHMQNKVLLDHYSGEVADLLGLNKVTVVELFSGKSTEPWKEPARNKDPYLYTAVASTTNSPELYLLSLLLHLDYPKLAEVVSKLDTHDFLDPTAALIYTSLLYYTRKESEFDINKLIDGMADELKELVRDLYLTEGVVVDTEQPAVELEVDQVFKRIKKDSARRKIKDISEKLRLAEKENNDKLITELTNELTALSKELY